MFVIFNWAGVGFLAAGLTAAEVVSRCAGISSEPALMLVLGPVCMACDIAYRSLSRHGDWLHPERGGSIFAIPIWFLGLAWTLLGAFRLLHRSA